MPDYSGLAGRIYTVFMMGASIEMIAILLDMDYIAVENELREFINWKLKKKSK